MNEVESMHQYEDGTEVAVVEITAGQLTSGDELPGHTGPHRVEGVGHMASLVTANVRDESGRLYSAEFNMRQTVRVIA